LPTLYLIVGLPCSGKTTLAKKMAAELPVLRLCPDEWVVKLYGTEMTSTQIDAVRDPVEQTQLEVALEALRLGLDVVQENGFWARTESEAHRERARAVGAEAKIVFLEVPLEELLRRLRLRNENLPPHTFRIREERLIEWWGVFESPTPEEIGE
jgi:predicted kinase